MSSGLAGKSKPVAERGLNGAGMRVGIACARWNKEVVGALAAGCKRELIRLGVPAENIVLVNAPGSYELPYVAKRLIEVHKGTLDAVVCVGCLIKGETMHFEYISEAVTQGIMKLNLETGVPVLFGVLACVTDAQARARAGLAYGETPADESHNHGVEWAQSAVEMATLRRATSPTELAALSDKY